MNEQACAHTFDGVLDIEVGVPLSELKVGDTVLGTANPDDPAEPRTVHRVTAALGVHHVPIEDPTILDRFLTKTRLERFIAGEPVEGILVDDPAMFTLEHTPVLDRVIF